MVHGAWQSMSQPFTPVLLTAHTLRRPLFSYLTGFWGVLCWLQVAKTPNPDLLNSDPGASNLIVSKSSISSRRQLINGKYSDKIEEYRKLFSSMTDYVNERKKTYTSIEKEKKLRNSFPPAS